MWAALLLLVGALLGIGCTAPEDRRELPPLSELQFLDGGWEYRYGDSPRSSDGSLLFAAPQHDDGGWRPAPNTINPPGRGNHKHLWLRTRFRSGPKLHDPVLLLSLMNDSFEAYVDGRFVAKFGKVEGPEAERLPHALRKFMIDLGDEYRGRTVALRIYSPQYYIGLENPVLVAGRAAALVYWVKSGLSLLVIGAILGALSLACLSLFLLQRSDWNYLLYSLDCMLLSLYIVARGSLRPFIFEEPVFWYGLNISCLCLIGAATAALVPRLIGKGPWGVLPWLSPVFLLYYCVGLGLVLSQKLPLGSAMRPLQYLWLFFALCLVVSAIFESVRGSTSARVFCVGVGVATIFVLIELLQYTFLHQSRYLLAHYAAAVFMLTLGIVLMMRFYAVHKRLADYSNVLRLSFSSTGDLSPGHQAQIALAELLRMLAAERGLLFLCKPDGEDLQLVAGRDAQGNVLTDPSSERRHDVELVAAVQKKRRPMMRKFTPPAASLTGASKKEPAAAARSVMAAPLLARGQLLGVLYLEAAQAKKSFDREAVEILLGLGSQVALTLVAAHAGKLESESQKVQKRFDEQAALLAAAARMARGDLASPITVPASSELLPLAQALDRMRQEILAKIHELESTSATLQKVNDELRHHIDMRLSRLLELSQKSAAERGPRPGVAGLGPGDRLGAHYRVISLLGEGRSSSVYEVERVTDGRHLAAKVFSGPTEQAGALRFAREARILASLSHPNVVSIADVDITDEGALLMVMELVRGTPLGHCQDRYRDLPWVSEVLAQIAAGLRAVHDLGIVHHDLKPANVIISQGKGPKPLVKLLDFGFSRLSADGAGQAAIESAEPGEVAGTPMYLAPELAKGAMEARPPSDIFSFGVVAYELLCGELPYSQPPIVSRFRGEPIVVPALQKAHPEIPGWLAQLVARCLHPDPSRRPAASDVLAAFDAAR